jgi:hypothetical protein
MLAGVRVEAVGLVPHAASAVKAVMQKRESGFIG